MKTSILCKGCWIQMHWPIPLHGPLAVPFRILGVRPSRMNPNICNMCETKFSKVKKTKQIVVPVALLFADIRGYTSLSESLGATNMAHLLTHWYDYCVPAIWERDGIVNKLMGDAILAVFNFPIRRPDFVRQAVLSGMELQKKCKEMRATLEKESQGKLPPIGVGIGISAGDVSLGEIGEVCKDFTVIGPTVNLASRLQSAAGPGEILVTEQVYQQVRDISPGLSEARVLTLKGIEEPVKAYILGI